MKQGKNNFIIDQLQDIDIDIDIDMSTTNSSFLLSNCKKSANAFWINDGKVYRLLSTRSQEELFSAEARCSTGS